MPRVLKHFKPSEFVMGLENVYHLMDEESLVKLDLLRERCGFPIKVSSCYRNEAYCKSKGIKYRKNSMHNFGKAFDIPTTGYTAKQKHILLKEATQLFNGIGIYETFFHVDTREDFSVWVG